MSIKATIKGTTFEFEHVEDAAAMLRILSLAKLPERGDVKVVVSKRPKTYKRRHRAKVPLAASPPTAARVKRRYRLSIPRTPKRMSEQTKLEVWHGRLNTTERKLMREMVSAHPQALSNREISERLGFSTRGKFSTHQQAVERKAYTVRLKNLWSKKSKGNLGRFYTLNPQVYGFLADRHPEIYKAS